MLVAVTIPGLALLLVALAFTEMTWRKVTGKALVPWMRGTDRPISAVGFEQFDAVFAAGRHHEFAQQQSTLMHRENPGDGAPGGIDVDLTASKATVQHRD
ncbi:DUF6191 domain-containing protein [Nocardia australiensis]|uniref:DUF6191 domain-containing protein n=1 Tax=Nocardia australiensis TaxID=2887191 RepID=UPI001D15916E|nr:DUF6191 domain-containing protein [Nocardia australiensis]